MVSRGNSRLRQCERYLTKRLHGRSFRPRSHLVWIDGSFFAPTVRIAEPIEVSNKFNQFSPTCWSEVVRLPLFAWFGLGCLPRSQALDLKQRFDYLGCLRRCEDTISEQLLLLVENNHIFHGASLRVGARLSDGRCFAIGGNNAFPRHDDLPTFLPGNI
jgi:hypothetical protein